MADLYGDKQYKLERKRHDNFSKSEKELDRQYKKIIKEESELEGLNRIRPEDSTVESEFAKGGLVGRGQGKAIKIKKTKMY
jgi:hypothetical protein